VGRALALTCDGSHVRAVLSAAVISGSRLRSRIKTESLLDDRHRVTSTHEGWPAFGHGSAQWQWRGGQCDMVAHHRAAVEASGGGAWQRGGGAELGVGVTAVIIGGRRRLGGNGEPSVWGGGRVSPQAQTVGGGRCQFRGGSGYHQR
jgi:hypothetical protein